MIEIKVKKYLEEMIGVPVYLSRPNKEKSEYIVLERKGKREKNHLGGSTFIIQSYAKSMYESARLNQRVKVAMKEITRLDDFAEVTLEGDYPFTDVVSKKYRYQAVFDTTHY